MGWLTKFLRREQTNTLPVEVSDGVAGCWFAERHGAGDDGDEPRLLFAFAGGRLAPIEKAPEIIRRRWPELNEGQAARALAWLESLAGQWMREQTYQQLARTAPKRGSWKDWRNQPPRGMFEVS